MNKGVGGRLLRSSGKTANIKDFQVNRGNKRNTNKVHRI